MDPLTIIAVAILILVIYWTWPLWAVLFGILAVFCAAIGGVCLLCLAYVLDRITMPYRRWRNRRRYGKIRKL